jgi:hypothetical protein
MKALEIEDARGKNHEDSGEDSKTKISGCNL